MIPVSGISPVTPPDDDERLEAEGGREPRRQQLREAVVCEHRDSEAPVDDEHDDQHDRCRSGQAELLCDGAVDEVRLEGRDVGVPFGRQQDTAAEPGPEQTTACDRIERLHELIALVGRVGPGAATRS